MSTPIAWMHVTRRRWLIGTVGVGASCACGAAKSAALPSPSPEAWMTTWMQRKALDGRLRLDRFVEPVYFLIDSIAWRPGSPQTALPEVKVPAGFVTELASIPRVFWSLLRPDDEYAHPAVIHDFLYWDQSLPREVADRIFDAAMKDLEVDLPSRLALSQAVKHFGDEAWKENQRLRHAGERRVLRKVPIDPRTRWRDWKRNPAHFL